MIEYGYYLWVSKVSSMSTFSLSVRICSLSSYISLIEPSCPSSFLIVGLLTCTPSISLITSSSSDSDRRYWEFEADSLSVTSSSSSESLA